MTDEPLPMVERVARALARAIAATGNDTSHVRAYARAAIEAMREPTMEMSMAGNDPSPDSMHFRAARVCFWISAAVLWGYAVAWGAHSKYSLPITAAVSGTLAAAAAVGLVIALRTVAGRERAAHPAAIAQRPTVRPTGFARLAVSRIDLARNADGSVTFLVNFENKGSLAAPTFRVRATIDAALSET